MSLAIGRRSALVALVLLLISAVTVVAASRSSAASAVDIVILGGESAVSASVAAELKTCTTGSVTRLAGTNRYNTAAAISKATFSSASGAYVATGLNFPDALAGGPPAALSDQPVLLVNDAVPASTLAELVRLGVSSVTVLGGPAVVPNSVVTSLNTLVPTTRIDGSDRYSTAAAIVQAEFTSATTVYVATGLNFPDALAGVPAAAGDAAPILLVQQNAIPAATAAQLSRLKPTAIKILGGEAVISAGVAASLGSYASNVIRLSGSDRYVTAAAISKHAFPSGASKIYIATGLNYPDALAGGPAAGANNAPILLVQTNSIPASTALEIQRITGTRCAPPTPPPTTTTTTTSTTIPPTTTTIPPSSSVIITIGATSFGWEGIAGSEAVRLYRDGTGWFGNIGEDDVFLFTDGLCWFGNIEYDEVFLCSDGLSWWGSIAWDRINLYRDGTGWVGSIGYDSVSLYRPGYMVGGSGPRTAAALVPVIFG
jgi:putative cell wall-binding protein